MKQSNSGLLVPEDEIVTVKGLVGISLFNEQGELIDYEEIANLVTQVGDEYYSERAAGISSPPAQVTGMQLGTGVTAAAKTGGGAAIGTYISGSNVAIDGTYPQSNNTGTITWRVTYPAGTATNAAITEVALINQSIATNSGAAAADTVARAVFSAKNKGASDSLVVTWTHAILGA
jgi:hypothetical protein